MESAFAAMASSPPFPSLRSNPVCPGAPRKKARMNNMKRTHMEAFGLQPLRTLVATESNVYQQVHHADTSIVSDVWEEIDLST